jgi:phage FluMu protein Com
MQERELRCRNCKRYLGKAFGSTIVELLCANSSCKATTQFKMVQGDVSKDMSFKFATKEVEPRELATKEAVVS